MLPATSTEEHCVLLRSTGSVQWVLLHSYQSETTLSANKARVQRTNFMQVVIGLAFARSDRYRQA